MRSVAVTSASGDQAAAIARAFVQAGWRVTGLTRRADKAAFIEGLGATPVVVDDADPDALVRALEGADVVAYTSPADYRDGVREALAGRYAAAARRAGVRRAVVNTAASVILETGPNAHMLKAVEDAFEAACPQFVSLRPTVFMDNLAAPWMIASVLGSGVLRYSLPAHARVSWISHRTLADFMVAAASSDAALGQRIAIGGPQALSGADVAREVGAAAGRELTYETLPLAEFIATLNANFGAPAGERIAEDLVWLETNPDGKNHGDAAARLLGVTPEPFAAWARRVDWRRSG